MTDTGVSDAELALLIAGLQPTVIRSPAPVIEPERDDRGPWFPANYRGECARCGTPFDPGAEIRADGELGWLTRCCGSDLDTADGIVAEKPAGPPPSTIRELRTVLMDFEAARPRSMQRALGPSELGTPCQQQIARKLAGTPRRPITEPTWAPFQGTAVHASMEEVVAFWNRQLGRERWLAEDQLTVIEGVAAAVPGGPDYPTVAGHGDAFDLDHGMVVDWKYVGTTALDKLRAGLRAGKHPAEQVSAEYRVQAHLYGMGHANKGRDVRSVRLVLLARSWKYDDSLEWTEAVRREHRPRRHRPVLGRRRPRSTTSAAPRQDRSSPPSPPPLARTCASGARSTGRASPPTGPAAPATGRRQTTLPVPRPGSSKTPALWWRR
jgi:hypothetical protein